MTRQAPYGSWASPITADLIVGGTVGLEQVTLDGGDLFWVESRPAEAGRCVIVRRSADGQTSACTPPPFNVRTRVHEYGGRCFAVARGTLWFSNFNDQRLYRQDPGKAPTPITPEGGQRFADGVLDLKRGRLICVGEDHTAPGPPVNSIVSVDLEGRAPPRVLVSGHDFYAAPALERGGRRLAWLAWNHPNMPWDGTELWQGELDDSGALGHQECVAGGLEESIYQPAWSQGGVLHFVSDRGGWWNLYRRVAAGDEPLAPREAEFGKPLWYLGSTTYTFAPSGELLCTWTGRGTWRLGKLGARGLEEIATSYTEFRGLQADARHVYFVGASPTEAPAVVQLDLATGAAKALRRSHGMTVDAGYLSTPSAIEFPTEGGRTAHAFHYRPRNQDFTGLPEERPPLLVISHGGPTGATHGTLRLEIQYWTSRGFAVLDVNYGGSTGYGRAYRERLNGQWGIVDVDDCVQGARYLVAQGEADPRRLAIRGGSAGGYTTLAALTFHDVFRAGASHYGVSDLEALARETHKFEARYLDRLIGPYPERRDLYRERSPINFTERLSCPIILLQGLEDKVVPPSQAETMLAALRAKGIPVAYLPFAGEQHGFRRAENIKRALEGELYFYARIFQFPLAAPVEPVTIENLP